MANDIALTVPNLTTQGPDYATQISNDLTVIATHDHDGVNNGTTIDLAAQACDADLSLQGHNLSDVRSVELDNQSAALTGSQDVNCLYVNQGALGFNNSDGIFVPITNGNGLAVNVVPFTNWTPRSSTVTANANVLYTDTYNLINIDSSGGAITVQLPIAATITPVKAGRLYLFRDIAFIAATHNITIQVTGGSGNTFSNVGNTTSITINNNGGYVGVYTDGVSKWFVWTQNVFNLEALSLIGTAMTLTSGSTLIADNTSAAQINGIISIDNGATENIQNGSHLLVKDTSNIILSGTAAQSFGTGTSSTHGVGSTCTINGVLAGSTTGGTLAHAGSMSIAGTLTCPGTVNLSGANVFTGSMSGNGTFTGAFTGAAACSFTLNSTCTFTNSGLTNISGETNATRTLAAGSYTIDSGGTYLDNYIGIVTAASGVWTITFPASPAQGRVIRIADVGNYDPATSTYVLNLNGGGHNILVTGNSGVGSAPSFPATIPNYFVASAGATFQSGWVLRFIFVNNVWALF